MTANPFNYEEHIETRIQDVSQAITRRRELYSTIRWMAEVTQSGVATGEPHSVKLPALQAITDRILELSAREDELLGIKRMAETAQLVGVTVQSTQVGAGYADVGNEEGVINE